MSDSCDPTGCSPPGFFVYGISQATGAGCHFLLQGVFLTQGSNQGLLHCRQILYQLSQRKNSVLVLKQNEMFLLFLPSITLFSFPNQSLVNQLCFFPPFIQRISNSFHSEIKHNFYINVKLNLAYNIIA